MVQLGHEAEVTVGLSESRWFCVGWEHSPKPAWPAGLQHLGTLPVLRRPWAGGVGLGVPGCLLAITARPPEPLLPVLGLISSQPLGVPRASLTCH